MTNKELAAALRLCGGTSGVDECRAECPFFRGADVGRCVPVMTAACADAMENHETHIMALQKAIEDLRARLPRWIPVEERLPSDSVDVLALVTGTYWNVTFERTQMIGTCLGSKEGWFLGEYPNWDNPGVTHWMPLPEGPEEAKDDD